MVAWSSQFVPYLLKGQHSVRDDLGTDVISGSIEPYNVNLTVLSLISMVMKAIQDIAPGTATDAFWQARLNIAVDTGPNGDRSGWPGWVLAQIAPEDLAVYGATEADSLAVLRAKIAAHTAGGIL
jgi:hypothetical protein